MIIIDTLQKIRELGSEKGSCAGAYNAMTRLKSIADRFGIVVMAIHHTRKAKSSDPFQMVSGTTGLMGCADNTFVMCKDDRASNHTKLFGTGRNIRDNLGHATAAFTRSQYAHVSKKMRMESSERMNHYFGTLMPVPAT